MMDGRPEARPYCTPTMKRLPLYHEPLRQRGRILRVGWNSRRRPTAYALDHWLSCVWDERGMEADESLRGSVGVLWGHASQAL